MRSRPLICIALGAAALTGCGSDHGSNGSKYDGQKAEVAAVIDSLGNAARDGAGTRICQDIFTSNLRISVTRAAHQPCADEVTQNVFNKETKYAVEDLSVIGDQATARVKDQKDRTSVLLLQKAGGRWRIARIG